MNVELKHSKSLSKKIRKNFDFKCVLFPEYKSVIKIDEGLYQSKYLKDTESIFSECPSQNSDEEMEKIANHAIKDGYADIANGILSFIKRKNIRQDFLISKKLKRSKLHGRKLIIAPLTTIKKTINPVKNIRFQETSFPLDSIIFDNNPLKSEKQVSCFTDVYDYKRIESVSFDELRKVYVVKMHEKVYDPMLYKHGINMQNYYIDWLMSLGNQKAVDLSKNLELMLQMHNNELSTVKSMIKNDCVDKLDDELDDCVNKRLENLPYKTRIVKYEKDVRNEYTGLVEEEYNLPYLKLIGYDESQKDEIISKFLSFDIQRAFFIPDFYGAIKEFFEKQKKTSQLNLNKFFLEAKLIINGKEGNPFRKCKHNIFEEKWSNNGTIYKKNYYNPVEIQKI